LHGARSLDSAGRVILRHSCRTSRMAEPVNVSAIVLLESRLHGHAALQRQHLLAGATAKGNAVVAGLGLQRPERAGLVRPAAVVGHVRLALGRFGGPLTWGGSGRTLVFTPGPPWRCRASTHLH
jgi:hypothetical protein